MSIITTTYTERKTITTDDAGNVTITTSHAARTSTEYLFSELSEEAKARAISDAIEEEQRTAYEWGSHTYFDTDEILQCAGDLQKQQPVEVSQDYGCSWYGTARGTNYYWHHPAKWEDVTEATDNGICWSMDMCDKWNEYAPRIIALQEAHEEATEQAEEFWSIASDADYASYDAETAEERERLEAIQRTAVEGAAAFEDIAERIENAAEELTEDAAHAVGNVVDGLIESQYEYNTSPEFWSYWLDDGETRFTRDGERI